MSDPEERKKGYQPFQEPDAAGKREEDWRSQIPRDYLRQNFDRHDRLAVVTIERKLGGESGRVNQRLMRAEEIASPDFQRMLRSANANGRDVYLSMNTMREDATGRTKADVDQIRHIYLDVDVGGKEALDKILKAEGMPNPHHVLETSPGKHQVIWQVEGFDKAQAEATLRNLAAAHGADPAVTDCSRVLRIPGFRNCKYDTGKPHYVRDIHESPAERTYRPEDFPRYPEVRQAMTGEGERPRFSGNGEGSQSERDWAYALRQLERGTDPAVIRSNIEAYRQDKSNPRYYAERTVSRAQAKFATKESSRSGDKLGLRDSESMDR